jgi:hypothetical protein
MDIYSLVAANTHTGGHPTPMSARAEDRYYSDQFALSGLNPGLLGSIAMTAGVILIFGLTLLI